MIKRFQLGFRLTALRPLILIIVCGFFLIYTPCIQGATFGQNNVNYSYFTWKFLTTEHFNIYYNQGGREIADLTAEIAEDAFAELSQKFGYVHDYDTPISVITYQSHNDFEQTNLSGVSPSEATGGFTEFLKNRVVVPFEGNHEKFRHVIHHELTHAMFLNHLFGKGFGAVVTGLTQSRIPLWFTEGLAEYQSRDGLDLETEMILRDAVINDLLPELHQFDMLGYMGVYKAGQSVVYWIAMRYGDEKVGELLRHIRDLRDFDRALRAAIGIDQKELSKRWRRWIKERYWPQVVKMDELDKSSSRMTDHEKDYCYINNSPALSPNGEWIAFLSDRSDYFDVYLMSTLDGKVHRRLVRGQRSGRFEELHWLRPGISWSPDGDHIAFCAKSGGLDALYIINVEDGSIHKSLKFNSDGLFSPSWSPDGKSIALVHVLDGRSDLAVVDIETGKLKNITSDIYDEADPSWSADSRCLLFTSNRGDAPLKQTERANRSILFTDYEEFDVYRIELESSELTRITDDAYVERTPIWAPDDKDVILYVSNRTGAYNLYLHRISTSEIRSFTNYVTGAFQPTISPQTKAVAFTSYFNSGYDIFLLNDPFNENHHVSTYVTNEAEKVPEMRTPLKKSSLGFKDYSSFIFNRLQSESRNIEEETKDTTEVTSELRIKDNLGLYPSKDYSVNLTPDLVYVNAGYSPYYAMQGSGMVMFTDVLGNHNLYLSLDLYRSIEWSNIYLNYEYLARRLSYSIGFYHYAYLYRGNRLYWQDQNIGLFVSSGLPLSRFNRLEFGINLASIDRSVYPDNWDRNYYNNTKPPGSSTLTVIPRVGYVHDTSIWRSRVEPSNGARWRVDLTGSPKISLDNSESLEFVTLSFDWRNYINYRKNYSVAFRFSGSASEGRNPQRFYMGGVMNWFNPQWDNDRNTVIVDRIDDIYFSSFITPMRGVGYYNKVGTRYLLGNAEFRFPFIRYLLLGWPLPIFLNNVRGAIFTDVGTAWKPEDIEGIPTDWVQGFGFGLRLDLGIFPLEWDIAWSRDSKLGMRPQYYFSINAGF